MKHLEPATLKVRHACDELGELKDHLEEVLDARNSFEIDLEFLQLVERFATFCNRLMNSPEVVVHHTEDNDG